MEKMSRGNQGLAVCVHLHVIAIDNAVAAGYAYFLGVQYYQLLDLEGGIRVKRILVTCTPGACAAFTEGDLP